MERQKKVLDASAITKWFLNESGSDHALSLREEHLRGLSTIIIPELTFLEVLNTLKYKRIDLSALNEVNKDLSLAQLHVERLNHHLLERALTLASQHDLTIYDACYLALARLHGCPLYTADHKLGKCPGTILLGEKP